MTSSSIINGTAGADNLAGTGADDRINGLEGNDILRGKGGNDELFGGLGNDILRGGAGDNDFVGGEGNDTYFLAGRYEYVEFGLGNDLIDLSNFTQDDGFLSVRAGFGTMGIVALIDGEEDFGFIRTNNGANPDGMLLFNDLNNALTQPLGGMQVYGTNSDDVFMIDAGANGWIQIRPGEGDDLIRIEGTSGTVKLEYSNLSEGIFASLKFGFVAKGADWNAVDQITGEGRVRELSATNFDDILYGSRQNDRFITGQGDDLVFGGAGVDTIRYDRSGVDAVTVNLSANTATGVWGGQAFSDTLKNIENIRGSRDGNDTLIGNQKDNRIEGKGGNDKITGKKGDDWLVGDDGNDRFLFKNNDGNDTIEDFEALNSKEKISLKGVSGITDFADLMANSVTYDGTDTIIDDGAGLTITLLGVDIADLDATDFIF